MTESRKDYVLGEPGPWFMRSTHCGLCNAKLSLLRSNMSNEIAEKYLGASGARHFCEKCWLLKVEELRVLAKDVVARKVAKAWSS